MRPTKDEIGAGVIEILKKMTKRRSPGTDEIGPETRLAEDLDFSSIDIIHLMASIDMKLDRKLHYDDLVVRDGRYVDDLSVHELVEFVYRNFDNHATHPAAM